jgi:hypothetical protein
LVLLRSRETFLETGGEKAERGFDFLERSRRGGFRYRLLLVSSC